jgi:hypothetical protein
MGKNKKSKIEAGAANLHSSGIMKVVGVLADESVTYETDVSDHNITAAINTIANNLQTHIDSTFALRGQRIIVDTATVVIPGQSVILLLDLKKSMQFGRCSQAQFKRYRCRRCQAVTARIWPHGSAIQPDPRSAWATYQSHQ